MNAAKITLIGRNAKKKMIIALANSQSPYGTVLLAIGAKLVQVEVATTG